MKFVIAILFIAASTYTMVMHLTLQIDAENTTCTDGVLAITAPWSAGCFYSAYYDDGGVSQTVLDFERLKMERFIENEGVSIEILWYRFKFHQKYQRAFKTNFQELHAMHNDYTRAEHTKLERQAEYWHFLYVNDLVPLAQQSLNNYCDVYIPRNRDDAVEEIRWRLKRREVPLNLEHCKAITAASR